MNGPFEEYYHNGLMILGYLPLSEYSLEEQQEMAFMLCVAALVGEGVYSFGELVRRRPRLMPHDAHGHAATSANFGIT